MYPIERLRDAIMEDMKLFGRRRRIVDVIVAPPCRACGSVETEVLDRHAVTLVPDSVLATSTWPAQRRERIISVCPVCGLVTDLGHPSISADDECELAHRLVEQGTPLGAGATLVDVVDAGAAWRSSLLDPATDVVDWFTVGSLARTVRSAGFGVRAIRVLPEGRIHVEVVPIESTSRDPFPIEEPPDQTLAAIQYHLGRRTQLVDEHRHHLDRVRSNGGSAVVWGATRSSVALLDALELDDAVEAVLDPDPAYAGQRLVGSDLPIVGPDHPKVDPSVVLVADASRREQVAFDLERAGRRVLVV
ncbi:MAG: hypothetical protein AAGA17_00670 [Actinomycetota bacterium]